MHKPGDLFASRINLFLTAFGLAAIILLLTFPVTSAIQSQTAPQPITVDDPKFASFVYDVVSIKPFKEEPNPESSWRGIEESPDGVRIRNAPVVSMIGRAFATEHSKVSGGPNWASRDMYDVEAKMEPEVADALNKLSPADQKLARQHMLQVFLRDYLKAAVHMETTEVLIYELVVVKNGSKLKEVTDPATPPGAMSVSGSITGTKWEGHATPIEYILGQMSYAAGRPVYDKTGLTGRYDFSLKYTPDYMSAAAPGSGSAASPPLDAAPPFAKALEEQLGLKLVPTKGNMDVIVIDHIEKPEGN
jgi:uncharacterized protein (TIGR03435 family)